MPHDSVQICDDTLSFAPEQDPRQHLRRLPRLGACGAARSTVACKICGGPSFAFDRVDFNKYCNPENCYGFGFSGVMVEFFRCSRCGFLFTNFCDAWTPDDFRNLIYNDDYMKVDFEYAEIRPLRMAQVISDWFRGAEGAAILDYGSGTGWFARSMRQLGFKTVCEYDPFSAPERPQGRFDIITCFEVIEHSPDPRGTFADLLSLLKPDGCILLSQTLQPDDILAIRGSWWYLGPRNGHVSTFTEEALELLGRESGLRFFRGDTIYGFAGPAPNAHAAIALTSVGPSFTTIRLFAPETMPEAAILSSDRRSVLWHRSEVLDGRSVRYTGNHRSVRWRAKWAPVRRIRVHIPFLGQAEDGFAASCHILLDRRQGDARLVRGDLTAEFDVEGRTSGEIELVTPEPVISHHTGGRSVGIAIPVAAGSTSVPLREHAGEHQ